MVLVPLLLVMFLGGLIGSVLWSASDHEGRGEDRRRGRGEDRRRGRGEDRRRDRERRQDRIPRRESAHRR